ncbi:hypothetical protein ACSDZS_004937 [Klebsiella pneumoniae]|uniref:hypothetical protein n=1 Tax=Klebsiella pneumoniae TaxID=573 RepID=UPI0011EAA8DD|nr:hypothetical protein [Klebsiella pneumoniae]TYT14524.1 hypothetical protein FZC63_26840 [Klebsiella pneumoniae]
MVSVAIKHPSDDVALQFIRNSIAINCKLHNNQQKTADLIYHNHTLRALNRQGVSQAGNFGGCGVEPQPGKCSANGGLLDSCRKGRFLSFSEDDCTRQRGLKAVVQSSIERTVSGVRCTNDNLKPVLVALATDQPLDGDGRENGQNRTLSMRPVRLRP